MTNDNPQPNESIASRTERALVEPLTVLDHDETGRVDDGSDDTDGDDDAAEPSPLAEEIAEVAPFARDE